MIQSPLFSFSLFLVGLDHGLALDWYHHEPWLTPSGDSTITVESSDCNLKIVLLLIVQALIALANHYLLAPVSLIVRQ